MLKFRIFHMADVQGSPSGAAQSSAQQSVQNTVANNQLGAESRRKLATANYTSNTSVTIDIPRDTSVKRIALNSVFAATATYASGSPTISPFGALARLCPNFYLVADGSRNIKVLDLYMARCMNALSYGCFPRRAYRTGASLTSSNDFPNTEWLSGAIAYGATTQDIIVNESLIVDFEQPLAYEQGKNISQLYTRNLATCNMTFGFGDVSNLQTTGVGATVTYSNVSLSIVPTIIENREGTLAEGAFDFSETVIRKSYSAAQTLATIDLNTGNKIVGLGFMAQNGDSGLSLADNVLTDMQLVVNGVNSIQLSRFRDLMNDNKSRRGVADDQYATLLHGLTGFAYMSLLKGGNSLSGLDARFANGVSQVQALISTGASSGLNAVTYTNPVTISVLQQQLVPVPQKG